MESLYLHFNIMLYLKFKNDLNPNPKSNPKATSQLQEMPISININDTHHTLFLLIDWDYMNSIHFLKQTSLKLSMKRIWIFFLS